MGSSNSVSVAIITALSSIVVTAITIFFGGKRIAKKKLATPEERAGLLYDGYEKLIREQQSEIDRKTIVINHFEELAEKYRDQIVNLESEISRLKLELNAVQRSKEATEAELAELKKELIPPKIIDTEAVSSKT